MLAPRQSEHCRHVPSAALRTAMQTAENEEVRRMIAVRETARRRLALNDEYALQTSVTPQQSDKASLYLDPVWPKNAGLICFIGGLECDRGTPPAQPL